MEYDGDGGRRRIVVPFIWIYMEAARAGQDEFAREWLLVDYRVLWKGLDKDGDAFEDFCLRFRALKSRAFDDGAAVDLRDLHHGAILQPPDLRGLRITNRHLQIAVAAGRTATKTSEFGQALPNMGAVTTGRTATKTSEFGQELPNKGKGPPKPRRQEATTRDGRSQVDITDGVHIFRNGKGASAADFAVLHTLASSGARIAECGQAKQGKAKVDLATICDERRKSCDADDLLVVYCTKATAITSAQLPPMTGIVGTDQWAAYFGPYAGRAFLICSEQAGSE